VTREPSGLKAGWSARISGEENSNET